MKKSRKVSKKRHHYLPEFYLKGFINQSNKPKIWIYEKGNPNIICSTPKNIAVQAHYYSYNTPEGNKDTDSFESFFSKIEAKIPTIFKNIREQKNLNDEEKAWFSIFLGFSITRVPNYRKNIEDITANIIKKILRTSAFDANKSGMQIEGLHKFILNDEYNITIKNPEYSLGMIVDHAFEFGRILNLMKWSFLIATQDYKFITSDNPVFIHNPAYYRNSLYSGGLLSKNIQVTFSISKEIALLGTWKDYKEGYIKSDNNSVKAIVKRTVLSALKYIYASNKSEALNRLVQKYVGIRPIIKVS